MRLEPEGAFVTTNASGGLAATNRCLSGFCERPKALAPAPARSTLTVFATAITAGLVSETDQFVWMPLSKQIKKYNCTTV